MGLAFRLSSWRVRANLSSLEGTDENLFPANVNTFSLLWTGYGCYWCQKAMDDVLKWRSAIQGTPVSAHQLVTT
ncbi:hypothetical protein E2C01_046309 [Portunus trituberculatus]|uniref:Uncharacterized protein n=1 Tax=Portunus trituberculatus TaxID=210409 RepID=A0A5B7FXI8_PORTR|nr:hypothetical protein [Portunus trituberculatus]